MSKKGTKPKPLVSETGEPRRGGPLPSLLSRSIDRGLAIQRPAVLAHLRRIRATHPQSSPAELTTVLERRYLATVTTSGAAVGATAVVPAIGTVTTLALSGVDTIAFLETTALYAQSLSEVHGLAVDDPVRARALVLAMMLGRDGSTLVRQFAAEVAGDGVDHASYWGDLVAASLPAAVLHPLVDRLKNSAMRRFAVSGGVGMLGRAIPFGIGAVIGGAGNNIVARRVVHSSRLAFGEPPADFAAHLSPTPQTIVVEEGGAAADTV